MNSFEKLSTFHVQNISQNMMIVSTAQLLDTIKIDRGKHCRCVEVTCVAHQELASAYHGGKIKSRTAWQQMNAFIH